MSSFYGNGGGGGISAKQIEKIKNHIIVSQYEPNIQQTGDIWIRVGNKEKFEVLYTKIITGRSIVQENGFFVICLEYGQPINIEENKQYFSVSNNVEIIENVNASPYALTMKIIDSEYNNDWEKRYNVNIKYKEYEETIQVIRFKEADDRTFTGGSFLVTTQDNENIDFSSNFDLKLIKRPSFGVMIKNQVFHLKPVLFFDNESRGGSSTLNLSANSSITNITNINIKNLILDSYLSYQGMSKSQVLQLFFNSAETQGIIPSSLEKQFGQIQVLEDGTLVAKKPGLCFPDFMNIVEFDGKNHFLSYYNSQTYQEQKYQLQNNYALDSISAFQNLFVLPQEWNGFKLEGQNEINLKNQTIDSFSWKVRENGSLLKDVSSEDLTITIENENIAEISTDAETGGPKIYCDNGSLSIDIQGKTVGDTKLLVTYNNETVEILIHVTEL